MVPIRSTELQKMATHLIILVTLIISTSLADVTNNQIDDVNPLDEAKAAILKEQNAENIGGMLSNLMQSDGAKQLLGNILMNAASGENGGQILESLGSMLGQGQGLDPSLLGAAVSMFQSANGKKTDEQPFDIQNILSFLANLLDTGGDKMGYLPMLLQTLNAFVGPEAQAREKSHSGHAKLMPSFIERIHLFFDHFLNSEMGRHTMATLGAEKFMRVFTDDTGRFNYDKFVEMLENHSFRKHWIGMITKKIAAMISYVSDPKAQKKYLAMGQHILNSFLKTQGYPKSTFFDYRRPTETISSLVNHVAKNSLQMKINSKQYVKPAVQYIQELFAMVETKGLSVDYRQLSDKLADTINMEVIEPIARVNRAYRFAKKTPKCDQYVMCLVNQEIQEDKATLPGLKPLLSKSASLIFSWFLSTHTGTSFWTLYSVIIDETNCQTHYLDACNDFHAEEIKVTTEYVHSEL